MLLHTIVIRHSARCAGSNTDSVAEHEIMLSLILLRNFVQGAPICTAPVCNVICIVCTP